MAASPSGVKRKSVWVEDGSDGLVFDDCEIEYDVVVGGKPEKEVIISALVAKRPKLVETGKEVSYVLKKKSKKFADKWLPVDDDSSIQDASELRCLLMPSASQPNSIASHEPRSTLIATSFESVLFCNPSLASSSTASSIGILLCTCYAMN